MKTRTFVPPEGDLKTAKLAIVGEQPGRTEVTSGRPFVGPDGRELNEDLHAIGLMRQDCYLTNFVKDLDDNISNYLNTKNMTFNRAGLEYQEMLKAELEQLTSNVIVAAGNYPLAVLTGRTGIKKWRGSILECSLIPGKWVVPCYHPATVIPPKFQYLNKFLIQFDLKRAKHVAENGYNPNARKYITKPSFQDSLIYLEKCYQKGLEGSTIDYDIEIYNEEVSCISFAYKLFEAISIPFYHYDGNYFSPEQELEIMLAVARILEEPRIKKRGQNIGFDSHFLLRRYGIHFVNPDDTMVAQRIIMPDYPIGLDFITSIWTDHPYYKDEGKKYFAGGGWEQLWTYSATDSMICTEAFPKQLEKLKQQRNVKTYERQRDIILPLVYMQERGILCDVEGMKAKNLELSETLVELQQELNKTAGRELNANSPKQLKEYFYGVLGYPAYKNRGQITTDDKAMQRLARKGIKEAELVQKIRQTRKLMGTYLPMDEEGNLTKIDKDNRVRSSFNPVGTRYSRISSSENIFGTGMNLQNQPHSLLQYMLIDPGYVGYAIDLSQAENRIVAYVGNVGPMIEAFETGKDVHALTAALIFQKPVHEISTEYQVENGLAPPCPLGDGTHDERFWGKKCFLASCEVLTFGGWIPIFDAQKCGYEIAQWDKDTRQISFVKPLDWYIDNYSGDIITLQNQRIFQQITPNHKTPVYYKGKIIDKTAETFPNSGKYSAPLSGFYSCGELNLNSIIRLMVAFQADGRWNSKTINFNLHKERKIERLKWLLDAGQIPYTNPSKGYFSISAQHPITEFIFKLMGKKKLFGSWLLYLNQDSMQNFLSELPHWDGYAQRNQYFTSIKTNAEWVQIIAHLCGKAANISIQDNAKNPGAFGNGIIYILRIRDTVAPATSAIVRTKHKVKNEPIICPTVPSGYILIRENDKISVSGNSNHGLNYDLGYKTFALYYQMPETQARFIVERYHMAYPGVRNTYHKLVRRMLNNGRVVTNLMGRNTLFMNRMDDALYKEAYSCIPQGTVGDVINERGLNYLYYSQIPEHRSVELLLQKHDEIVFQVPLSEPLETHARILLDVKQQLEIPLETPDGRKFVVPADISVLRRSFSKREAIEIKSSKAPTTITGMAEKLKGILDAEK